MENNLHPQELFPSDRTPGKGNQKEFKKFLLANYYDSNQVALILEICLITLYRMRKRGAVPFIKVYDLCLYPKIEILELAKARIAAQLQKKGGL